MIDTDEAREEVDRFSRLNVVLAVSEFQKLVDLAEWLDDKEFDRALEYVVKLMGKPDVPLAKIPTVIVEIQALSAKMQLMAAYYQNVKKDTQRKNTYYSMYHALDKLVDAIKYLTKGKF